MGKFIMLIGIPGSGKTTYSKGLSEKYNAKVISTDKVRQTYVGIDEQEVFPTVYRLCSEELKEGRNVILDATHITPKVRKRTFDALDTYQVAYEKIAVYVDTSVEECIRRVEIRNKNPKELFLPLEVISSYGANIIPPSKEEGFSEIIIIKENNQVNLEEILLIVNKEFETDTDEYMKRTTIITDIVYEGYNPLCITIDYLNEPYLTDLGVIRDIFERVSEEEWINLCSNHGFTFEKGRIQKKLNSIEDIYKFIELLKLIVNK